MRWIIFAFVLNAVVAASDGEEASIKPALAHRVLKIDSCSAKVPGGHANLKVGLLNRGTNDVFGGEFEMKIVPYFFKNDKGALVISIPEATIAKATTGSTVEISGTATSAGKNHPVRQIKAEARPVDGEHGALKLWIFVDDRKMFFETKYQFVE